MKVLTLSIKQKYFDEIIADTKKQEFREIRPTNSSKYFKYACGGREYESEEDLPEEGEVTLIPVKYDAIKFLTGEYKGKRPFIVVNVKGAEVQILTDENGKDVVYIHEGEEYLAAQIVYELGEIIEKSDY